MDRDIAIRVLNSIMSIKNTLSSIATGSGEVVSSANLSRVNMASPAEITEPEEEPKTRTKK